MVRVGWVTAQFDSALLLHNTPTGRDIDLTNWSFTISTLMMETEISETLVFSSILTRLIAREKERLFIHWTEGQVDAGVSLAKRNIPAPAKDRTPVISALNPSHYTHK
jgi:hypothetical protein